MTRALLILSLGLIVPGCSLSEGGLFGTRTDKPAQEEEAAPAPLAERVAEAPPASGANTADTLDTTSEEDRARAVAEARPGEGETDLGMTIASLGAVSEPGIWLKTPLVTEPGRGRVEYAEKGTAVSVDLIPLGGEPGAGSRISLAAMRLIEADLTDLPELRVFRTE